VCEALSQRGVSDVFVPRSREYDLTQAEAATRLLEHADPHVVIHLAAQVGGIGANQKQPGRFFYANMAMGLHLIERARTVGLKKFVQLGTVCAYPKFTPVPFKETDLWNGYPEETNAPYGLAKKMLLVQGQAYRQQYGFSAIYLLPVNLYGPGDNFNPESSHVIPALIQKILEAKEQGEDHIVAWGTGSPSREFLYVEDAAEGILLATKRYNGPEPVNLGAGCEITICDLTETVARLCGFAGAIRWDTSQPDGQPRRMLDTRRANEFFGFRAETDFETGLRHTIDWYTAVLRKQRSEALSARGRTRAATQDLSEKSLAA
jgi:GDP-L-fucose synthase